jgi:methionine-rich copper-binding protein CopC
MITMTICPHLRGRNSALDKPRSTVVVTMMAAAALGLALFTSLIGATSASAHAELVKITPERNAQLGTEPKQVTLEFNERLSTSFATVVVTTSAGVTVTSGKPKVVGAKVTQMLSPGLDAGRYRVAFRVVSADGHPVTGESVFSLTTPRANPSTQAPPASSPSAPTVDGAQATSTLIHQDGPGAGPSASSKAIAGGIGLVIAGACVLLWRRKRS